MRLEKGSVQHLDACEKALLNSSLGHNYFNEDNRAREAIEEGIANETLYVVRIEDHFVGFLYYLPTGAFHSFPYLHLFVVAEDFRGKGLGKQMLELFEALIFDNTDKVFLVVADFNHDAKRFYEKYGYSQVGEIPSLYREGVTEFLMMKVNTRK